MSYIGTTKIGGMYLGSTKIGKAYLGTDLVYQKGEPVPNHACLTFRSSSSNTLSLEANGTAAPTLYYSTDGTTWTLWDYSAVSFSTGHPVFVYGNNPSTFSTSDSNYARFLLGGNGDVRVSGNVMVLIDGTGTTTTIPCTYCFDRLFFNQAKLKNTPELPATTLTAYCYYNMFNSCSGLTETMSSLPATTVYTYSYASMFYACSSLTSAPSLPATTLAQNCYRSMFNRCSKLTTAPALNATSLQNYCYYYMFYMCSSLTTPPALPATTLKNYCYADMFYQCTSLTTAPDLPAKTLVSNCYAYLFYGCTKLNHIKAMFTTTPSTSYTSNWVNGVASSGTFIKNSSATWTTIGIHGVPNGWTVQTASS